MILTQVDIEGIRNLKPTSLKPGPGFNLITGANGAGKTSLLEAIHLLSAGHSFRTRKTREILNTDADSLSIISKLHDLKHAKDHRAGIQKYRNGDTHLKLDYEPLHSMAQMTRLLPVKALFPDSHKLIQDGPSARRQFLDWGLFHVEQDFFAHWKIYKRALEQRNQALRRHLPENEVIAWNGELSESGSKISEFRQSYVQELRAWLTEYLKKFGIIGQIGVEYKLGWSSDHSLPEALKAAMSQCQRFRTTTVGPHRGELAVSFDGVTARQIMSRGQQKLLVYALHFAQLALFEERNHERAIVLCDDLPAELDVEHRNSVLECLNGMKLQSFITSNAPIDFPTEADSAMFHVEHGEVQEVV